MHLLKISVVYVAFGIHVFGNSLGSSKTSDLLKQNPDLIEIGVVNGKSFYTHYDRPNWTAANQFCEDLGLHWGKIVDENERDLISEYVIKNRWHIHLSATDEIKEKKWLWAEDNTALNFSNWGPGSPKDDPKYNYAYINFGDGQWYDSLVVNDVHPLCFTNN